LVPCPDDDAGHGGWDHGSLLDNACTAVVSCAAVSLVTTQATWASLTGAQTPHRAMVRGPRLAVELPLEGQACQIQEFCGTRLHVGEPDTDHLWCLLSGRHSILP